MTTTNEINFLPTPAEMAAMSEAPLAFGPAIGTYLGMQIHAWIELSTGIFDYVGIAIGPKPGLVDLSRLASNEVCVTPGLRYALRTA